QPHRSLVRPGLFHRLGELLGNPPLHRVDPPLHRVLFLLRQIVVLQAELELRRPLPPQRDQQRHHGSHRRKPGPKRLRTPADSHRPSRTRDTVRTPRPHRHHHDRSSPPYHPPTPHVLPWPQRC